VRVEFNIRVKLPIYVEKRVLLKFLLYVEILSLVKSREKLPMKLLEYEELLSLVKSRA